MRNSVPRTGRAGGGHAAVLGGRRPPRRFLRQLARIVAVPWLLASSEDLRYPELADHRPFWMPLLQRYTKQVFRLAASSARDYDRLLRVLHLIAGPELLFHPATMIGVVGTALRGGGRAGIAPAASSARMPRIDSPEGS